MDDVSFVSDEEENKNSSKEARSSQTRGNEKETKKNKKNIRSVPLALPSGCPLSGEFF